MPPTNEGYSIPPGNPGGLDSSIEQFDAGDCPNPKVPWLVGINGREGKAVVFRPRCKLWSCPVCGRANAWSWAYRANAGAHALYDRYGRMDFVCITSHEKLSPQQSFWVAPKAWMKLQARIRRAVPDFQYFAVPEVQARTRRVHFHLITNAVLTKTWWKTNGRECGFGYQNDRREVYDLGGVVGYAAKYLTKSLELTAMPKGTRRVRTSRHWPRETQDPNPDWAFNLLPRHEAIAAIVARLERHGYRVAVAGSKSAWRYVES